MSLTDVIRLQELIQLNSVKDEWITDSKIVVSPFGDFMAIASTTAVAFYMKKYSNSSTPEFQLCRVHKPYRIESSLGIERSCGSITAIYYIPVKMERQGRSHDLWHCVVVGYSSGRSRTRIDIINLLLTSVGIRKANIRLGGYKRTYTAGLW